MGWLVAGAHALGACPAASRVYAAVRAATLVVREVLASTSFWSMVRSVIAAAARLLRYSSSRAIVVSIWVALSAMPKLVTALALPTFFVPAASI